METTMMKSPIIPGTGAGNRRKSRRSYSSSFSSTSTNFSFESSSFFSNPEEEEDHHDHYSPSSSPVASGVPFSWEQQPGIPKRPNSSPNSPNSSSSSSSSSTPRKLPDPPVTSAPHFPAKKLEMEAMMNCSARRKNINSRDGYVGDPFTLALMKCCASKDQQLQQYEVTGCSNWKMMRSSNKVIGSTSAARSFSDRFGFIDLYASCKRTSDVLESKVLIPRSRRLVDRN